MLIKIIISIFAIIVGILYGLSFIYIARLSEYLKKRGEVNNYYKFLRTIFVYSLPITASFIIVIIPVALISVLVGKEYIHNTKGIVFVIYILFCSITFFITLFILIKAGILKSDAKR